MIEAFALIDFALVAAPPERVVQAAGKAHQIEATLPEGATLVPREEPKGWLERLFSRDRASVAATDLLRLADPSSLGPSPLSQIRIEAIAPEAMLRVSAPIGAQALCLIEFRQQQSGTSPFCLALSSSLENTDVFYFRNSGVNHPGADYAFHVYRDGRLTRRVESASEQGTHPDAPWTASDKGMPHTAEAGSLPLPDTPAAELMTPERQAIILKALGIEPDTLFSGIEERPFVAVLSEATKGAPLSDIAKVGGKGLRGPAHFDGAQDTSEVEAPREKSTTEPRSETWETEVTALLVEAVEAALAPEEQVAWLDALTQQLNEGDMAGALSKAQDLIAKGNRGNTEKAAAAARLALLFNVSAGSGEATD